MSNKGGIKIDIQRTEEINLYQGNSTEIIPCLKELLQFRLSIYSFLGFIFYNKIPSDRFQRDHLNNSIRLLISQECDEEIPGRKELQDYLNHIESSEGYYRILRQDFQDLFEGPGKLLAPPWESVYLSEEQLMFESQTIEVRELHRKYGLQIQNFGTEPEDHIGLELQFMGFLASRAVDLFEPYSSNELFKIMKVQKDFLQKHLLLWVDQFTSLVQLGAKTSFYKGLALFLLWYLENDAAFLNSLSTFDITK